MNNENRKKKRNRFEQQSSLFCEECGLFLSEYGEDNSAFTQNKPFSQVCDGEI